MDNVKSEKEDLSKYTDKELFELYQNRDDLEIRNELIERHYYIAQILSKKYINKGIEYEDLLQVASLGLIYAIQRYDPSKGFAFSSFATPTIIGEIKKYFRDKGWQIRVPRRIQELSGKIKKARVSLEQQNGKVPKIKDIAKYLEVSEEEVLEAMDAQLAYSPISLDLKLDNDDDSQETVLGQLIGQYDNGITSLEEEDFIKNITKDLSPREKKVIQDRFFNGKTQTQVAEELGVSQMTVSRTEKKIIEKLRKEYAKNMN